MLEDLSPEDIFKDVLMQEFFYWFYGEKNLNVKEDITNDLFLKALVSTHKISKKGMTQLEKINDLMTILENKIHEENKTTENSQDNVCLETSQE